MKFNRNCKSFPGTYTCDIMKSENYKDCEECLFHEPISKKILIIKLEASGDVIRTTTILPALKEKYGNNIKITWLTTEYNSPLLLNNPYIDQILPYNQETILRLKYEYFDILLSLEADTPGTLLANLVNAKEKFGYFFDKDGHPNFFNKSAEPYLNRVFSDNLSKNEKKTYQEMIFEIIELSYKKQNYILNLKEEEKEYGKKIIGEKKKKLIGINIGAGGRWLSKSWHPNKIKELIRKLPNYQVILLGGKKETQLKKDLIDEFKKENIKILENDSNNSLREYLAVINSCDLIITGDSLALHMAIALNKKTIALFFCSPPWQIEDYGLVKKLTSPLLNKFYLDDQYNEELVNSISVEQILREIQNEL